jgi:hypothetical protein
MEDKTLCWWTPETEKRLQLGDGKTISLLTNLVNTKGIFNLQSYILVYEIENMIQKKQDIAIASV